MKLDEFRERLAFDRDRLDDELIEQAQLYFSAAEECAHAVSRRDEANATKDVQYAEACEAARTALEQSEEKVTEGKVKELAGQDENYREAVADLSRKKLEADLWAAMKESFVQRGWALREMCEMVKAEVFSVSSVRTGAAGEMGYDATKRRISGQNFTSKTTLRKK